MARAIWKGAISFSLVHIPVQLYSATRGRELDLDMLDKRDFAPVGYSRYNKSTGKEVEWKNVVKGYQYEKGEYVVLTEEDFRQANVAATQTIDIDAFVDRAAIPPYCYETPYFLAPEKSGARVYRLLHDALLESDKLAVASLVMRSRQHLCALMPVDGVILLNTLRYADEIATAAEVMPANGTKGKNGKSARSSKRGNGRARGAAPSDRELSMALKLIDELSAPWRPQSYHDTYREDLMKRIREKIESGRTHALTAPAKGQRAAARGGKVVDLMGLLKQSLEATREADGAAAGKDTSTGRRSRYGRRRASRSRGRRPARRRA
jgi:DNA end-binding protein Ku